MPDVGAPPCAHLHVCRDCRDQLQAAEHRVAQLTPRTPYAPQRALTAREIEVVAALADGLTVAQAAKHLSITAHTVKSHVGNVREALGLTGRTSAAGIVALALRRGWIR